MFVFYYVLQRFLVFYSRPVDYVYDNVEFGYKDESQTTTQRLQFSAVNKHNYLREKDDDNDVDDDDTGFQGFTTLLWRKGDRGKVK